MLRVVASGVDQRIAAESIVCAANAIAGNVDGARNELIVGASATNLNFSFGVQLYHMILTGNEEDHNK